MNHREHKEHRGLCVLCGLVFLLLFGLASTALAESRPNLLLVTIDTLRADRLGSYGYSQARTPALDQLAREGVRFERAFSPVPLTLPSHATILTGTYPSQHGIRDNSGYILPPGSATLAEILKRAGYSTGAFVSAFVLDSKFGLDQGFDRYFDDFDLSRYENVSPGYIQRTADAVVSEALRWLNGRPPDPFFAWVHLYDPHDPYTAPEPYASRHPGRPYDAEIEFADAGVGRLVEWLKEKGRYDSTLIVVLGDHGESLGEHGESKHGLFVYNATLHVPWIMRLPGGASAGAVPADNVSLVDVFPTVLQILGIDRRPIPEVQGSGQLSLILGKGRSRADLYAECYYPYLQFGWSPLGVIFSGKYKYIHAPEPEIYDLSGDFGETRNLAPSNRGLTQSLRDRYLQLAARFAEAGPGAASPTQLDAESLEKLSSLGYVALSSQNAGDLTIENLPDPKGQIKLYNRILDLFERSSRGEYRQVIPGYQEVLRGQPDLKIVRYKLGQAYFFTGNYAAAVEQFQKTIELGGENALAHFDLAQCYLRLNQAREAMTAFLETLAIDPNHYRARANLAVLYRNQGRVDEAIQQLEKARQQAPHSVFVLNNLGISYSMAGEHEKGLGLLSRAVALEPDNAFIHANLGLVYRQLGKDAEARQALETARRLNPDIFQQHPGLK